jgi:murein DD-endopeptidase MepM/ murein hydrolase activator NlpD
MIGGDEMDELGLPIVVVVTVVCILCIACILSIGSPNAVESSPVDKENTPKRTGLVIETYPVSPPKITQCYGGTKTAHGPTGQANNYCGYSQCFHGGIDWGGVEGQRVYAGISGTVVEVWSRANAKRARYFGDYRVDIRNGDWCIIYGHMNGDIQVKEGQYVVPATVIGGLGDHLHWEFRRAPAGAPAGANCLHRSFTEIHNPMTLMAVEDSSELVFMCTADEYHQASPYGSDPLRQPILSRQGPSLWSH